MSTTERVVCRVCRKPELVYCWPADQPQQAVCTECCPEHEYSYSRGEGWTCDHCGIEPPPDYFEHDD